MLNWKTLNSSDIKSLFNISKTWQTTRKNCWKIVDSFYPSNSIIPKNCSMLYSEIENNVPPSSYDHQLSLCRPVLPAIELCLCIPHSNVTLEKYFSQTSLIKKTLWRQLNNQFERSLTYQNQRTILQYFSQGTCPRMCTSLVQNQGTQQGKCKVSKKGLTDSLNFLSTSSEADALVKRV